MKTILFIGTCTLLLAAGCNRVPTVVQNSPTTSAQPQANKVYHTPWFDLSYSSDFQISSGTGGCVDPANRQECEQIGLTEVEITGPYRTDVPGANGAEAAFHAYAHYDKKLKKLIFGPDVYTVEDPAFFAFKVNYTESWHIVPVSTDYLLNSPEYQETIQMISAAQYHRPNP